MELAIQTKRIVDAAIQFEELRSSTRGYLGMSFLGHPCTRLLWYSFRLCGVNNPLEPARVLRLFNRGHREEPFVLSCLEKAGLKIHRFVPGTEDQFEYVGSYGHAKGHSDGLVYNMPEFPFQYVLLEIKTHNSRNFTAVTKRGVRKANPVHYCQIQRYLAAHNHAYPQFPVVAALYVAVNKDNDSWHLEIVRFDEESIDMLINREMTVIEEEFLPNRLINDSNFFTCRFCNFNVICHTNRAVPKHCRTCKHVVVCDDGVWKCENSDSDKYGNLTLQEQLEGCKVYVKNCSL